MNTLLSDQPTDLEIEDDQRGTVGARAARLMESGSAPIVVALLAVCIALSFSTSSFLTAGNLTNIVTQSSVVGIAAVGATFVIITSGIDLSVGANVALSGMAAALLASNGLNGFAAIAVALAVAAGIGALNGLAIAWIKLSAFIVTLALLGMTRGLTLQLSQGESVYDLPDSFTYLGSQALFGLQVPAILTVLVFVIGHIVLTRTVFGHQVFAVGGNPEAARLSGIRVGRVLFIVYVIAGLTAGLAAVVLVGRLGAATPTAATGLELQVIAGVVIGGTSLFGGKGSMLGTFVGVLLIGVINNGLTLLNVSPYWVQFVQGSLILVAVLIDALNTRRLRNRTSH